MIYEFRDGSRPQFVEIVLREGKAFGARLAPVPDSWLDTRVDVTVVE